MSGIEDEFLRPGPCLRALFVSRRRHALARRGMRWDAAVNSNNGYSDYGPKWSGQQSGFNAGGMSLGQTPQGPYDATKGKPVDNGRSQYDWRPYDGSPGMYQSDGMLFQAPSQFDGMDISSLIKRQGPLNGQLSGGDRSNLAYALMGGTGF